MVREDTKKQLKENNQKNCTCLIISVVVMLGLFFVLTSSNKGKGQKGGLYEHWQKYSYFYVIFLPCAVAVLILVWFLHG